MSAIARGFLVGSPLGGAPGRSGRAVSEFGATPPTRADGAFPGGVGATATALARGTRYEALRVQRRSIVTSRNHSVLQLASRAMVDIPRASAALVVLAAAMVATTHHGVPQLEPLVAASSLETGFQAVRRAQYVVKSRARFARPALPANETYSALWRRALDATDDIEAFVEGWFDLLEDCDECRIDPLERKTRTLEALTRGDVEEWIALNTFGARLLALRENEVAEVVSMRCETERALGRSFRESSAPSSNSDSRYEASRVRALAPTVDNLAIRQHPLLLYALLAVQRRRFARELSQMGFVRGAAGALTYWFLPPASAGDGGWGDACTTVPRALQETRTPLVFAHGIGVGLPPYAAFVERLARAANVDRRAVFLMELPAISTTLGMSQLPTGATLAQDARLMLAQGGFERAVFVAHSFGSAVAAFVSRHEPSALAGVVLVEPVVFLLNLAKSARRVFYHDPSSVDPALGVIASDPGNSLSLRRFWWYDGILHVDDLAAALDPERSRSAVFLADDDLIVPSADVARYLQPHCLPDKVLVDDAPASELETRSQPSAVVLGETVRRRSLRAVPRATIAALRDSAQRRRRGQRDSKETPPERDDAESAPAFRAASSQRQSHRAAPRVSKLRLVLEHFHGGHGKWQSDAASIDRVVAAALLSAQAADAQPHSSKSSTSSESKSDQLQQPEQKKKNTSALATLAERLPSRRLRARFARTDAAPVAS